MRTPEPEPDAEMEEEDVFTRGLVQSPPLGAKGFGYVPKSHRLKTGENRIAREIERYENEMAQINQDYFKEIKE